jgi:hypothetical protein
MRDHVRTSRNVRLLLAVLLATACAGGGARAEVTEAEITLYGHAQLDAGYDFGRGDPANPDRLRVSHLPSYAGEHGREGVTFYSVRQSRFGFKSRVPTEREKLLVMFEFDLMGSGSTPRLRHFYGEYGQFGAGQYWSPFTDVEAYPAIFESFGPNGIPWVRNAQIRWMPLRGDSRLTFAIEKPGATGEGGDYEDLIALQDVQIRLRTPVLSAAFQRDTSWGHARVAGLLRRVWWDDLVDDAIDLSGDALGWGLTASGVYRFGERDAVRLQYVIGEGIENFLNDSTVDIGPRSTGDAARPVEGVPLPVQAVTAYVEVYWSERWGAVGGFSWVDIDNSEGQSADAFAQGTFASATLRYEAAAGVLLGLEYQHGRRENFRDGWHYSDDRIQLTCKAAFSHLLRPGG